MGTLTSISAVASIVSCVVAVLVAGDKFFPGVWGRVLKRKGWWISGLVVFSVVSGYFAWFYEPPPAIPGNIRGLAVGDPPMPIASKKDLKGDRIVGKTVFLTELVQEKVTTDGGVRAGIANKSFERCLVVGPGVIWGRNCAFVGNGAAASGLESMVLEYKGQTIIGVIAFYNCGFEACRFVNTAIAGDKQMLETVRKGFR